MTSLTELQAKHFLLSPITRVEAADIARKVGEKKMAEYKEGNAHTISLAAVEATYTEIVRVMLEGK